MFANYSDVSRQYYTAYMDTLNFNIPLTEQNIEQQLVLSAASLIPFTTYSNNKITVLMQNRERLADEYSICPSSMKELDNGSFFEKATNTIGMSNFNCTFHEHGKHTLAHELGHALSYWFSKNRQHLDESNRPSKKSYNQYMTLRKCANQRYKTDDTREEKKRIPSRHDNDKFRTEEDMADLISLSHLPG